MRAKTKMRKGYMAAVSIWITICFMLTAVAVPKTAEAQLQDIVDTKDSFDVYLQTGDLVALKVYSLTRIAVSRPGIVDVANADVDEVLLIGQKVGETPIFIWDELGKRKIMARVLSIDLDLLVARLAGLMDAAEIYDVEVRKNPYERKIILTGQVDTYQRDALDDIVAPFEDHIIDMVKKEQDLIQIDVQVTELNTTLTKVLGFNWSGQLGTEAGQVGSEQNIQTSALGLSLDYEERLPEFDGSIEDFFKIGDFQRTTSLLATVDALIREGKGRILSKPSLVVSNGEEASFLVGGEIPIRTTTTSTGGASVQENISFTSYGIDLEVTPQIRNDKIDMEITVQIRDIDAANAVGENVAFVTRNAETQILLNSGQTIIMAGLIKHNQGETVQKVPFVGAIPLLGALFRTRTQSPNQEQEVVISLTPRRILQADLDRALDEQKKFDKEQKELTEIDKEDLMAEEASDKMMENETMAKAASGEIFMEEDLSSALDERILPSEDAMDDEESLFEDFELDYEEEGVMDSELVELIPSSVEEDVIIAPEPSLYNDNNVSQAITGYVQAIQSKISENISFPYTAKERGWKGTAVLILTVLSDGTLDQVNIKESSGHEIFDNDALNTAQIIAPFDEFPMEIDLDQLEVTIPIIYSQEAIFNDVDL